MRTHAFGEFFAGSIILQVLMVLSRTIAVTPRKSAGLEHADVKRVCHDYTLLGLRTMIAARNGQPFRVCYTSGAMAERDQTKTPTMMPEHVLMRVRTSFLLLQLAW
jgi:hypothetical protein